GRGNSRSDPRREWQPEPQPDGRAELLSAAARRSAPQPIPAGTWLGQVATRRAGAAQHLRACQTFAADSDPGPLRCGGSGYELPGAFRDHAAHTGADDDE